MTEDIRYCKCTTCTKPMVLGWDMNRHQYMVICDTCRIIQPLVPADNFNPEELVQ